MLINIKEKYMVGKVDGNYGWGGYYFKLRG